MTYDSLLSDFMAGKYSRVVKQCTELLDKLDVCDSRSRRGLLNNRAQSYLKMGIYRRSIQDAKASSEIDPSWFEPKYTLIQALVKMNKMDEAKEVYEDWQKTTNVADLFLQKKVEDLLKLERTPTKEEKKDQKKNMQNKRNVRERIKAEEKKENKEKINSKETFIDLDIRVDRKDIIKREKHETAKFAFTSILIKSGQYKKAISEYTLLLRENPDLVKAYVERGELYAKLQKYDKAVQDFNNAVVRDRQNIKTLMKLAQARSLRAECMLLRPHHASEAPEQFSQAILEISRAIKMLRNTDDKDTICLSLRKRGTIFRKMSNFEYALHDYQDALKYVPNHVETMIFTGLCLTDLGRCKDAIKVYKEALSYAKGTTIGIIHNNLGVSLQNMGNSVEAEKHWSKAIKAKNHDCYSIRGMYRYLTGRIQKSIKDMNKAGEVTDEDDIGTLQLRLQIRGVAYHSLGQYRWARKDYTKLLATNPIFPGMLSWFRQEMLPVCQRLLDRPFTEYNFDHEFDKSLKTSYVQMKKPETVSKSYKPNNGKLNTTIKDVNLAKKCLFPNQRKIRDGTHRLGPLVQYTSPGFTANIRGHRMFGLAVLEIAQTMQRHWKNPIQVKKNAGSLDRKAHVFGWRDMMDIAVRWRQHSEPNDAVFWCHLLENENHQNGTRTDMVNGQKLNEKYYEYHDRCFKIMKPLICEQKNLSDSDKKLVHEAKTIDEVHTIVGCDFLVQVHLSSRCEEEEDLEGTRIILQQKEPDGYSFSIQIPIKPERNIRFDKELTEIFNDLEHLMTQSDDNDLERSVELILSFYYYWVNFGGLSRGTAVCGLILLNGLLMACGYLLTSPIPGMQIDWEAITTSSRKEFIKKIREVMEIIPLSEDSAGAPFNALPKVFEHITTLREMITILNVKE